jgi:hypothetical protein
VFSQPTTINGSLVVKAPGSLEIGAPTDVFVNVDVSSALVIGANISIGGAHPQYYYDENL